MRSRRLLWRPYSTYLAITLASLAAVGLYAVSAMQQFYGQRAVEALRDVAHATEETVRSRLAAGDHADLDAICKELGEKADTRITVILPDGKVVADSLEDPEAMDNHAGRSARSSCCTTSRGCTSWSKSAAISWPMGSIPIL
jgi:two-component system, OmpR family, phosphate regulon sensor histidine kinase PhoR